MRSTGDGYLLTFYDPQSAEMAAVRAFEAVFELVRTGRAGQDAEDHDDRDAP